MMLHGSVGGGVGSAGDGDSRRARLLTGVVQAAGQRVAAAVQRHGARNGLDAQRAQLIVAVLRPARAAHRPDQQAVRHSLRGGWLPADAGCDSTAVSRSERAAARPQIVEPRRRRVSARTEEPAVARQIQACEFAQLVFARRLWALATIFLAPFRLFSHTFLRALCARAAPLLSAARETISTISAPLPLRNQFHRVFTRRSSGVTLFFHEGAAAGRPAGRGGGG